MLSTYVFIFISTLLRRTVIAGSWSFTFSKNCAIDDEGNRRFYSSEGYVKCTEESCPFDATPKYTDVLCCHLCCSGGVKVAKSQKKLDLPERHITEQRVNSVWITLGPISVSINGVLIVAFLVVSILLCQERRRLRALQNEAPTQPNVEKTLVDLPHEDTQFNEKQLPIQEMPKQHHPIITTDSTATVTGKRFSIVAVTDLGTKMQPPPSYTSV